MNKQEIMKILPHRDNMLLLDEAEKVGDVSHAKYYVRGDEFFLKGHFPNNPIVPGVILCEILAQSSCILLQDKISAGQIPMYAGLDKVRFKSPVKAGDTIETECKIIREVFPFYFIEGKAVVNGKVCVTAEFSLAIVGE